MKGSVRPDALPGVVAAPRGDGVDRDPGVGGPEPLPPPTPPPDADEEEEEPVDMGLGVCGVCRELDDADWCMTGGVPMPGPVAPGDAPMWLLKCG